MIKMKKIIIFLAFFASSQSLAQTANTGTQASNNKVNNAKNVGAPIQPGASARAVAPQPPIQAGSNVRASAPIPPVNAPKLTPQEKAMLEKNLAENKDFQSSIQKLTPIQQKKFQSINQDFSTKMAEYYRTLNDETSKISKIQNILAIHTYISKGALSAGDRSLSRDRQDYFQKQIAIYNQLSPDKKKLIKQALIKFRKNVNALEKQRRQEFKLLFKKDFENFKEIESADEIEKDSKL
jgi:hypothetical protein